MHKNDKPACPKCEREKQAAELTETKLAEIVSELPVDMKLTADEKMYQKRLAVCNVCDALRNNVLCSWCGCYVMLRARPKDSYCPYPGCNKWEHLEGKTLV